MDRIIPGPLIARPVRNRNLRDELPIPDRSAKILLLGFGGFSIDFPLQDSFLPVGWVCVVLGDERCCLTSILASASCLSVCCTNRS